MWIEQWTPESAWVGGVLIADVVLIRSQDPHTESCLEWLDSTTPLVLVGENSLLSA